MPQITGGRVIFSRTVQPAQYESKRAEVELQFVVEDGEELDHALQVAGDAARKRTLELVGLKKKRRES